MVLLMQVMLYKAIQFLDTESTLLLLGVVTVGILVHRVESELKVYPVVSMVWWQRATRLLQRKQHLGLYHKTLHLVLLLRMEIYM